jgi:hypothetical protein
VEKSNICPRVNWRPQATLGSTILSRGSAELALDYLIDRYNFDLDALKAILVGRQFESASDLHGIFSIDFLARDLDVSFSNVKYTQIAPSEGLEPGLQLWDAPTFEIRRARIPNE